MVDPHVRPFAVVTGASSGIGYEVARCCAARCFDLAIAADDAGIEAARASLAELDVDVKAVRADLATSHGIDALLALVGDRPVDALVANAGHGLGHAFLDQDFDAVRHVIDTNVTGTLCLVQAIGRQMRQRGEGRILLTGSIAGLIPGSFQAAYNGSKAFIDSFALARRNELKDCGVTVTCLMPGATDTHFFERAGMLDTKVAQDPKDDPAQVARAGFQAMMEGRDTIVTGLRNKLQAALADVTPGSVLAEQHRRIAQPRSSPGRAR